MLGTKKGKKTGSNPRVLNMHQFSLQNSKFAHTKKLTSSKKRQALNVGSSMNSSIVWSGILSDDHQIEDTPLRHAKSPLPRRKHFSK